MCVEYSSHLYSTYFIIDGKVVENFDGIVTANDVEEKKPAVEEVESKKDRSVLQSKLTRLAIQIGYAGTFRR